MDAVAEPTRAAGAGTMAPDSRRDKRYNDADMDLPFPAVPLALTLDSHSAGQRLFAAVPERHQVVEIDLADDGRRGRVRRRFGCGEPGCTDGSCHQARLHTPSGLTQSGDHLFVADAGSHTLRSIDLIGGCVETIAGTGEEGVKMRAGNAHETALCDPTDVLMLDGILLFTPAGSHQVWHLVSDRVTPLAGSGRDESLDGPLDRAAFRRPVALAGNGSRVYVADETAATVLVLDFEQTPRVEALVFPGGPIRQPIALACLDDQVCVADAGSSTIHCLDPEHGTLRRLASLPGVRGLAVSATQRCLYAASQRGLHRLDLDTGEVSDLELPSADTLL